MATALKNAPVPEHIPTYEGSNQATHPSVLFFQDGWRGYPYWMAMTPYPFNNDGYEDPSILASRDGRAWEVPAGVKNPLAPAPRPGHNCDADLVYAPECDELRLYYVEADDLRQSWVKLLRSSDGVRWTAPETVVHDPARKYGILSPAIERLPQGGYQMWYVDTGDTGYICQENHVRTRTSKDGIAWSEERGCPGLTQPRWNIWHIDVYCEPQTGELHAMYPAYPAGGNCDDCALFYAVHRPGEGWRTFPGPILAPGPAGAWDDFCIYRSSLLLQRAENRLRVWYGGKRREDASWRIGLCETPWDAFLRALEAGAPQ